MLYKWGFKVLLQFDFGLCFAYDFKDFLLKI